MTNGFELVMTEPVASDVAIEDVEVRRWRYVPTEAYGGPKVDEEVIVPRSIATSEMSIHFLKPSKRTELRAEGRMIKRGRRQDVVEMLLYDGTGPDASDQRGGGTRRMPGAQGGGQLLLIPARAAQQDEQGQRQGRRDIAVHGLSLGHGSTL